MNKGSKAGAVFGENDTGIVVADPAVNADSFYVVLPRQLGLLDREGDADFVSAYVGCGHAALGGRRAVVHGVGVGVVAPLIRLFDLLLLLDIPVRHHAAIVRRVPGAGIPAGIVGDILADRVTRRHHWRGRH